MFRSIEESSHDYSFVDFQLCLEIESLSFPHILTKPSERCACFGNSCISLVINKHISGQSTAKICELVYSLQFLALDCTYCIYGVVHGCMCNYYLRTLNSL